MTVSLGIAKFNVSDASTKLFSYKKVHYSSIKLFKTAILSIKITENMNIKKKEVS